ncbi:DUF4267 domain-containing protein [Nocardioides sp.]|uniref:DUF4267 domain-containing protein n=1 Tax=Nocardioides sp. TaxID=35761 RepID=UPI0026301777|nr:DUF4267 domain-containing protein [Nocardioides sp.]MDI6908285.1 DUF4267 domain-containing protein [Nocardioides sp.]
MNPVIGLSLGRVAVGTVALANPDLAAKLFQLDPATNPQLPYLTRLFGSREIALGLITLLARDKSRRNLVLAGILVDGADAATGYLAMQEGTVSKRTALTLIVPAVGAIGSGISGLFRR